MLGVSSLCSKPGCVWAAGLKCTQILGKYASGWKFRYMLLLYLLFISGIKINTAHMASTWDCFPIGPAGRNSFTFSNWMNSLPFKSVYNTWLKERVRWSLTSINAFFYAVVKWWKTLRLKESERKRKSLKTHQSKGLHKKLMQLHCWFDQIGLHKVLKCCSVLIKMIYRLLISEWFHRLSYWVMFSSPGWRH